jgi:hypothetical protein
MNYSEVKLYFPANILSIIPSRCSLAVVIPIDLTSLMKLAEASFPYSANIPNI